MLEFDARVKDSHLACGAGGLETAAAAIAAG
jgi:hypothetical protein